MKEWGYEWTSAEWDEQEKEFFLFSDSGDLSHWITPELDPHGIMVIWLQVNE